MRSSSPVRLVILLPLLAAGCTDPVSMVQVGAEAFGKVVRGKQADDMSTELVGKNISAADQKLGARTDVYKEANGQRSWYLYKASADPLNMNATVVEARGDKIVNVAIIKKSGNTTLDIPRALLLKDKTKGKTPQECTEALDMGGPVLRVKNETNGHTLQLYDAKIIKVGSQVYGVAEFGSDNKCEDFRFITVEASGNGSVF